MYIQEMKTIGIIAFWHGDFKDTLTKYMRLESTLALIHKQSLNEVTE